MEYLNDEYQYGAYFKDEYGFPLSLSESMKYCELDKVPCILCEEYEKKSYTVGRDDSYCPICHDIYYRFLELCGNLRRPRENGSYRILRRKEDHQVGHMCYKLVEKELELFRYIDFEFISWELCHYVVKKDPSMIKYVPNQFKKKGKLKDYSSILEPGMAECIIL